MMKLVNDILEVSRLEAKQVPLARQPISMTGLITDTLHAQSGRALDKGLHLESDLAPSLPPAYADPELIERVLQNLVDNAIKFTPPGGRVRLSAQPMNGKYASQANGHAGQLRISVSDEGPGIPRPLRSQLFQKFVTGGQPESGSGLGLAFCRLAVEAHGGHIWAESEPGRGATFAFTLPVACN
jgi:signal transduction histidine kinase